MITIEPIESDPAFAIFIDGFYRGIMKQRVGMDGKPWTFKADGLDVRLMSRDRERLLVKIQERMATK